MSDADTPIDPATGEVLRALDLALIEWRPDYSYRPLALTPRWFTGTVPWSSLPFLQHFADEARRYLHDHLGGVIASDQFAVDKNGEELLLRARALRVDGRLVLAIERLLGAADVRPILREARQQALDHEILADKARAVHVPLAAVTKAADDLQRSDLSEGQRVLFDRLSQALGRLQTAAAPLPAPRQRR